MLIEPTESESKASLDLFIATLRDLAMSARRGETGRFIAAPFHAPRRRLDETRAARNPVLRWTPPAPISEAAEQGTTGGPKRPGPFGGTDRGAAWKAVR